MYNEEMKLKYLSEKRAETAKVFGIFLEKLSAVENELNKDISLFSKEECLDAIAKIKPRNSKSAKVYCSVINGYTKWLNKNDVHLIQNVDPKFYLQFD